MKGSLLSYNHKLLIFFLILVVTGCSVVRIDTSSIDNILNVILTKDNKLYNQVGQGYKYYLPGGVTYIDSDDLNDILYCNGTYYYLYIDAISYYYDKIDMMVDKSELNNAVLNSSYILSTIKYNHNIVELLLEDDYFTNKTGKYNNYNSKGDSEKFVLEKDNVNVMEEG